MAQEKKRGPLSGPVCLFIRYYRRNIRSALAVTVWFALGVILWVTMAKADVNLLINLVGFSASTSVVFSVATWVMLNLLANKKLIDRPAFGKYIIGVVLPLIAYFLAAVTGFFFSTYISGDWPGYTGVPSACFGFFHTHHWQWSLFYSTILFVVMLLVAFVGLDKIPKYKRIFSWVGYGMAAFLIGCFFLYTSMYGWFRSDSGLWRVLLFHSMFFIVFARIIRSKETSSVWFVAFIAISLGVVNGITADGVRGIFETYPGSLIYYGENTGCGKPRIPVFIDNASSLFK